MLVYKMADQPAASRQSGLGVSETKKNKRRDEEKYIHFKNDPQDLIVFFPAMSSLPKKSSSATCRSVHEVIKGDTDTTHLVTGLQ